MIANRRTASVGCFAMLVFVLALVGASGLLRDTPWPVLNDRMREPPPLVVLRTADGQEQRGERGTYNWDNVIGDAFAVIVPARPVEVRAGEEIAIDTTAVGEPAARSYHILRLGSRAPTADPIRIDSTHCRVQSREVLADAEFTVAIALPPGNYAVEVFITLADGRYTVQGFHLLVRETGPRTATPTATANPEHALPPPCADAMAGVGR